MASEQPTPRSRRKREQGVPMWMPLLALLLVLILAILLGARIFPTLSALILPAQPRLPVGKMTELQRESKGTGLDEWLYGTDLPGCAVAEFYKKLLTTCVYDPSVVCREGQEKVTTVETGEPYTVAQCNGVLAVGEHREQWTVYIATNYIKRGNTPDKNTVFRLIREVAN